MSLNWTDRVDGVDDVLAADINSIAHEVEALDENKQDKLVSGQNIKTINNNNILGEGNLDLDAGEENVLEGVNINNTPLPIDINKKVNINTETPYNDNANKLSTIKDIYKNTKNNTTTDAVINNALPQTKLRYKIYGNSIQSENPNYDNPVEIQSVGDLVETGEHAGEYAIPIAINGITQTTIYLDAPLRKVGDNVDYIDFENQKIVRVIQEKQISSSQFTDTYLYSSKQGVYAVDILDTDKSRVAGLCNLIPADKIGANFTNNSLWIGVNNHHVYWIGIIDILEADESITLVGDTDLDKFKNWLDTTSDQLVIIQYADEPVEEDIVLPDIFMDSGNNEFSVLTTVQPSSFSKTYSVNTSGEMNVLEGVQINGTDLSISNKKVNILVDNSPTQNSSNLVKSSGVYTALAGKLNAEIGTESQIDTYIPQTSKLYYITTGSSIGFAPYYIFAFTNTIATVQVRISSYGIDKRTYDEFNNNWSAWTSYQTQITFNTTYDASTNKAATMADITDAIQSSIDALWETSL